MKHYMKNNTQMIFCVQENEPVSASQLACHCVRMLKQAHGAEALRSALLKDAVACAVAVMRFHAIIALNAQVGSCEMAETVHPDAVALLNNVMQTSGRLMHVTKNSGLRRCMVERWVVKWAESACQDMQHVLQNVDMCD
jgi:hypothetical protein